MVCVGLTWIDRDLDRRRSRGKGLAIPPREEWAEETSDVTVEIDVKRFTESNRFTGKSEINRRDVSSIMLEARLSDYAKK